MITKRFPVKLKKSARFSHAFSHRALGFFPNGAEWAWERLENLETPFLLCIFAPGVEKTGWKFQAAGG
jgi:hypothetical protein